jgi:hypothetical protein
VDAEVNSERGEIPEKKGERNLAAKKKVKWKADEDDDEEISANAGEEEDDDEDEDGSALLLNPDGD